MVKSRKKRSAKQNLKEGAHEVYLYGDHAVLAALHNPKREIIRLSAMQGMSQAIIAAAKARAIPLGSISKEELQNTLGADSLHQGVMLQVLPLAEPALEDFLEDWKNKPEATVVVLDQIADGRNLGGILRSALCLGADAVICTERHSARESSHLAKTASGALEGMPLIRVNNLARSMEQLKQVGFWCYGFAGEAEISVNQHCFPPRVAFVFGAEGQGLRRLTQEHCDQMISIPQHPLAIEYGVDSLNLGQSVSISLYARLYQAKDC